MLASVLFFLDIPCIQPSGQNPTASSEWFTEYILSPKTDKVLKDVKRLDLAMLLVALITVMGPDSNNGLNPESTSVIVSAPLKFWFFP